MHPKRKQLQACISITAACAIRTYWKSVSTTSIELLEKLISFDTTSAHSNLALIEFVRSYLSDYQVEATLIHDDEGKKANLYARLGPAHEGGFMLSGHTDVVPVAGQQWSSDPFSASTRNGRIHGRGSADMKGFIACALAAVPRWQQQSLQIPLHLAFSYDEEVGCLGAPRLADMIAKAPSRPAMAIIGEPTLMQPVVAHKGKIAVRTEVSGLAGHSAYTSDAVNAVEYAARLVTIINDLHREQARDGLQDAGYRVPHTTLHVGKIQGGTALNIVPADCSFDFEIRHLPETSPEHLLQRIADAAQQLELEMQRGNRDCCIRLETLASYPGLPPRADNPLLLLLQQWLPDCIVPEPDTNAASATSSNQQPGDTAESAEQNLQSELTRVSFGTEAGIFSRTLGIPSVVCGPGSIQQAHKPDEFIAIEQMHQCDQLMQRLGEHCANPQSG